MPSNPPSAKCPASPRSFAVSRHRARAGPPGRRHWPRARLHRTGRAPSRAQRRRPHRAHAVGAIGRAGHLGPGGGAAGDRPVLRRDRRWAARAGAGECRGALPSPDREPRCRGLQLRYRRHRRRDGGAAVIAGHGGRQRVAGHWPARHRAGAGRDPRRVRPPRDSRQGPELRRRVPRGRHHADAGGGAAGDAAAGSRGRRGDSPPMSS